MRSSTWRPIFVSESEHSHETLMRMLTNVFPHTPSARARASESGLSAQPSSSSVALLRVPSSISPSHTQCPDTCQYRAYNARAIVAVPVMADYACAGDCDLLYIRHFTDAIHYTHDLQSRHTLCDTHVISHAPHFPVPNTAQWLRVWCV